MTEALKRTPLDSLHQALDAKMVPFAGWSMPVQYPTGIQAEHRAVRSHAGLFDVSHMGEFRLAGPDAERLLLKIAINDASRIEIRQAQYSALCHDDGTVIDDLLIYRLDEAEFLAVVNASNCESDLRWVREHARGLNVSVEDWSDEYALLALQGPAAAEILQPLASMDLDSIGYYRLDHGEVAGLEMMVARTGYTGEDGFELYLPADDGAELWSRLMDEGADRGLQPCGLGARDTLRLEVGYPLYGNDLDRKHTALESGLGWVAKLEREGDFIGRDALRAQKAEGVRQRLTGIQLSGRGFPRPGYPVIHEGERVGEVTSGTLSPSLGVGIALAYVPAELARPDTPVAIGIRDREVAGMVTRPPFYQDGSVRR